MYVHLVWCRPVKSSLMLKLAGEKRNRFVDKIRVFGFRIKRNVDYHLEEGLSRQDDSQLKRGEKKRKKKKRKEKEGLCSSKLMLGKKRDMIHFSGVQINILEVQHIICHFEGYHDS